MKKKKHHVRDHTTPPTRPPLPARGRRRGRGAPEDGGDRRREEAPHRRLGFAREACRGSPHLVELPAGAADRETRRGIGGVAGPCFDVVMDYVDGRAEPCARRVGGAGAGRPFPEAKTDVATPRWRCTWRGSGLQLLYLPINYLMTL